MYLHSPRLLVRVIGIAAAHDRVQPNKGPLSTVLPRTDMQDGNGLKLAVTLNIRKLPSRVNGIAPLPVSVRPLSSHH